jgi:hypothetical protein
MNAQRDMSLTGSLQCHTAGGGTCTKTPQIGGTVLRRTHCRQNPYILRRGPWTEWHIWPLQLQANLVNTPTLELFFRKVFSTCLACTLSWIFTSHMYTKEKWMMKAPTWDQHKIVANEEQTTYWARIGKISSKCISSHGDGIFQMVVD